MKGSQPSAFVFRKNDNIGSAAAEDDVAFLEDCYVDNGDLEVILDCGDPKRVIVGRTGAGKSALISMIRANAQNVIELSPGSLSLNYIANNELISYFDSQGLNLSLFYGLLWKHILVVELLKAKFGITNEDSQKAYMSRVRQLFEKKDRLKEMAIDYFEKFGNKFWLTTEERIKELTAVVESKLEGALQLKTGKVEVGGEASKTLTEEEKKEIFERGQNAVSEIQVRELQNLIGIMGEDIFTDPQNKFYVVIDSLDEEWVDERIKAQLIKSLIETASTFRKVSYVKIVVALRQDLLDRVINSSRVPGFQEEKFESLYLRLKWSKKTLTQVVEDRINLLVRRRYTKEPISAADIFCNSVEGLSALNYMIERTLYRPRDIIVFVNECIYQAEDANHITATAIHQAEEEYSRGRLESLATEWLQVLPELKNVSMLFSGLNSNFQVSDITEEFLTNRYIEIAEQIDENTTDRMVKQLATLFEQQGPSFDRVRSYIIQQLFLVGIFGIKTDARNSVKWSTDSRSSIGVGQIKNSSTIYFHPMFYRALSVQELRKR